MEFISRHHRSFIPTLVILSLLFLLSSSSAASLNRFSSKHLGEKDESVVPGRIQDQKQQAGRNGYGVPSCVSKCMKCEPCKPVLMIPIQQGSITPLEYYPEVWRCKCGNQVFIP